MKRVFITEYVGLSTRLETLTLAFLISEHFGHEVCLDWHELDALEVLGAQKRRRGLLDRFNSLKLSGDNVLEGFHRAPKYTNINVRTCHGPNHLLRERYLPTAQRIKLRPDLISTIRKTFAPYQNRPLVGVHIRRGDFALVDPDTFDVNATTWPAVPDWWYAHVMTQIQRAVPDVVFFVSCSGSLDDYATLQQNFELFDLPTQSPYGYKGPDHASARHPAADLFALACCDTLVGSPCSTFTHFSANMLGRPTQILVPPAHKISRIHPVYCKLNLYGRGLGDWLLACRKGQGLETHTDAATLALTSGAYMDWM